MRFIWIEQFFVIKWTKSFEQFFLMHKFIIEWICFDIRSPRSLSPYHSSGAYDDIADYSPDVSDFEDHNEDDLDSKTKPKRKDDSEKDNCDILQRILDEQSASKCELEQGNNSDQGEHDDADDTKESMLLLHISLR